MHGIHLSLNENEGFRLPINPEEIRVSIEGDGEEFTISRRGNINIPKDVKLNRYTLESYFPLHPTHLAVTPHIAPRYYKNTLVKWQKEKSQIRYIYSNGSFGINVLVTIKSFDYWENDASGDMYFILELKKYVNFAPKKMQVKKVKGVSISATVVKKKAPPRENKKPKPKTYSLKKGDSLWKVAQKYTGKGNSYPALAKLNNIKPSQYRKLPIGLKLKIPLEWTS